jgi:hypothetical protein
VLADGEVNELNLKYIYADLGKPWKDRYLEHEEPSLQNYWDQINSDLEEDFEPDEDHTFNQAEIDALEDCELTPRRRKSHGNKLFKQLAA